MPRLIHGTHCPHCGAELPSPKPLLCPQCAGSLRQKHLKAGCLSSAPKLLVSAAALSWVLLEAWRLLANGA